MTAVWPASFPQCFVNDSEQEQPEKNWEEFETDYGPPLTSKRGTARQESVSGTFKFDIETYADFKAWFREDCGDGSVDFVKGVETYRWAAPYSMSRAGRSRFVQVSWLRQPT